MECTRIWPRNLFRGDNQKKNNAGVVFLTRGTFLHDLINVSTQYFQILSNSIGVMACTRFHFRGHKCITKKVRVIPLANCLKQCGSYGLHKILASEYIMNKVSYLSCRQHAYWSSFSSLPNIIKISLRVSKYWLSTSSQGYVYRQMPVWSLYPSNLFSL